MNISNTESKSINAERGSLNTFSKLSNSPLKNNGNLVLTPSCSILILSIASISPNCQAENLSLNISIPLIQILVLVLINEQQ